MIQLRVALVGASLSCFAGLGCAGQQAGAGAEPVRAVAWPVDNTQAIGGYRVELLGQPEVVPGAPSAALCFGGTQDGVVFPVNPLDAQPSFTVQALFKPDPSGAAKQQFLHLQDGAGNRVLMEIRMAANGRWYLHSFVRSGDQQQELASSDLLHPAGEWYWVALTYEDGNVRHFVNAQLQGSGTPTLAPMTAGEMAVGTRLSHENWFKGCVRELRFATAALDASDLARDVNAPSVLAKTP